MTTWWERVIVALAIGLLDWLVKREEKRATTATDAGTDRVLLDRLRDRVRQYEGGAPKP